MFINAGLKCSNAIQQIDVYAVIDHEFRHSIVKVAVNPHFLPESPYSSPSSSYFHVISLPFSLYLYLNITMNSFQNSSCTSFSSHLHFSLLVSP